MGVVYNLHIGATNGEVIRQADWIVQPYTPQEYINLQPFHSLLSIPPALSMTKLNLS